MHSVVAACTTAAACDAVEIGPPLWMLATAMIGIFVLLIGGAIAIGAVYARRSRSGTRPGGTARAVRATDQAVPADPTRPGSPTGPHTGSSWAHAERRRH